MSELTQAQADELLRLEKEREDDSVWCIDTAKTELVIPIRSTDARESFVLDISRHSINLAKVKYQNRARTTTILARLELGGAPHTNPDGSEVRCPHIHLYREGFADRWAFALPDSFTAPDDLWHTLDESLTFCNIVQPPIIKRPLW